MLNSRGSQVGTNKGVFTHPKIYTPCTCSYDQAYTTAPIQNHAYIPHVVMMITTWIGYKHVQTYMHVYHYFLSVRIVTDIEYYLQHFYPSISKYFVTVFKFNVTNSVSLMMFRGRSAQLEKNWRYLSPEGAGCVRGDVFHTTQKALRHEWRGWGVTCPSCRSKTLAPNKANSTRVQLNNYRFNYSTTCTSSSPDCRHYFPPLPYFLVHLPYCYYFSIHNSFVTKVESLPFFYYTCSHASYSQPAPFF